MCAGSARYLTRPLHRTIRQRPGGLATGFQGRRQARSQFGKRVAGGRGRGVMEAGWNGPDLTEAALEGGWMHTGDAAYSDDDRFARSRR